MKGIILVYNRLSTCVFEFGSFELIYAVSEIENISFSEIRVVIVDDVVAELSIR